MQSAARGCAWLLQGEAWFNEQMIVAFLYTNIPGQQSPAAEVPTLA